MSQQIEVPGDWNSIAALMAFVDEVEAALPLSAAQAYVLRLVVEEIATNVVKYGYADGRRGSIRLACSLSEGVLRITLGDRGVPFDPRAYADPDLSGEDASARDVGGLGLFFVRELSDELHYHHDPASGWNELVVLKGA
jgi:anti-sigma regulatory factor (Ser/Thr protein kinase)